MITLKKNTHEELRIEHTEYRGHALVSMRVWWREDDDEWRPSRKGITLRRDQVPVVMEALEELMQEEPKR